MVVKPISGAASSGVAVCGDRAELQDKLDGLDSALEWEAEALGLENGVFHLEAFIDDGEFVFLEIGRRPGGGEILWVTHRYAFPGQGVPDDPEYDFTGWSAHLYPASPIEATALIERLLDVVVIEHRDSCAVES